MMPGLLNLSHELPGDLSWNHRWYFLCCVLSPYMPSLDLCRSNGAWPLVGSMVSRLPAPDFAAQFLDDYEVFFCASLGGRMRLSNLGHLPTEAASGGQIVTSAGTAGIRPDFCRIRTPEPHLLRTNCPTLNCDQP